MTLPGVDLTVASGVAAAVGDIRRFADPTRLVSYLGLNPSVRQSGEGSAYHGRRPSSRNARRSSMGCSPCLTQNVTGQLLADDWVGAIELVRWRLWRERSAWARGAR
ncbi:IS110 family transposase [Bradyrhizobium sp. Arg816]|uniref:IS110 family transposase n=1 Tax=Bradyrhizobium sp. Arg816 TaxID=2998491 RepID=UPI00249E7CC3|nr:IS110 family transposase [Bradyrhizobium sp. Arg816]MDI3567601.1 IS110 family transposase [Bradyrhizobium sp. Arg816]